MRMPCITLKQPWATLVAIGAKQVETRSWGTALRGPIAIHASKRWERMDIELCFIEPFKSALLAAGYGAPNALPLGQVIAVAELVGCSQIQIDRKQVFLLNDGGGVVPVSETERHFGWFASDRYGWMFGRVVALAEPVPAVGKLGIWSWQPPPDQVFRTATAGVENPGRSPISAQEIIPGGTVIA